mgnify:CR=1 FL=1|jgi:hypothetical protein
MDPKEVFTKKTALMHNIKVIGTLHLQNAALASTKVTIHIWIHMEENIRVIGRGDH